MNESIGGVESREQRMLREEQKMKQLMVEQYYKYLTLLRITNNFEKCLETYSRINFSEFSGEIALIGRITEIAMGTEKEQDYCFPLVSTTINKHLFEKQETPLSRRPFTPITRRFVISNNTYKKKLIVPLNKVISTSKKNKEQLFIFTHLQLLFRDEKELCFGFSDNSFIMQLDQNFYSGLFKNLEQSLTSNYSDLNLSEIFLENELTKGSTFVVQDIRNKIHENINNFVVLGVLKHVNKQSMLKPVNAKEKQVALDIIQDVFHHQYKSVGTCRLYVRFDILDENDLNNHLQLGCVYMFLVTQIFLSDNVFLNLKLNFWRKNFIRITNSPVKTTSMPQLFNGLQLSTMNYLTTPCIFRNYYKFKVLKYELKLLYAKLTCQRCESAIYRSSSYDYFCKNQCGKVNAQLRLWCIIGVMDNSCYGELSMEDKVVLDYFDITNEEEIRFKEQVALEEQEEGKTGITLYFKKTKEDFNDDDPNQCITHDRNEFIGGLIERCLIKVIHKTIIGQGKINTNENFNAFDEEVKHEALTSFAKSKEFFRKAKVFVNGHLRTFEGRGRLIPYIKVQSVLS